jgi:DNA-binding transcriptional regulator LsrR (DeoR family)
MTPRTKASTSLARGGKRSVRETEEPSPGVDESQLEKNELLAIVCSYFCNDGLGAAKIKRRLKEEHGLEISRERIYPLILHAAARGWIRFTPPQPLRLYREIKEDRYPWLHDLSVVPTARSEDVSFRGAKTLMEILQQRYADEEVHIGFSGGYSLRRLAQRFAQLLREPAQRPPRKIIFHAMVAGFDVTDPTTDPNAFFTYFVKDPTSQVATSFVGLHAPAMARAGTIEELREVTGIREAYEQAGAIDIIVTSASCWEDEHCTFRNYRYVAGDSMKELEAAGCLGDMLWQPLGSDGPIPTGGGVRAMTIMDLGQVSQFVADKNLVLLVAGPCGVCHRPKDAVVRAILEQPKQLITHLVVDSGCARALVSA